MDNAIDGTNNAQLATRATLTLLGFAPFIASTLGKLMAVNIASVDWDIIFGTYAAIILSFLAGSLWGETLGHSSRRTPAVILSNVIVLVAWGLLFLDPSPISYLAFALSFLAVHGIERRCSPSRSYLRLRQRATTLIVVLCVIQAVSL
jgi:hypothetical protein